MGGCCGRPDNRNQKSSAKNYFDRYAYMSSHQLKLKEKMVGAGSKCSKCDAITVGDPCNVCGGVKVKEGT